MCYCTHFKFAFGHGIRCIKAGVLLIIHSLIPALFPKTGSHLVNRLNESFTEHNDLLKLKQDMQRFRDIIYDSKPKA